MAGRSFTRHSNGVGNRIRAEHINELQVASEADDARIDAKADAATLTSHTTDTANPHDVTKAQLGLGNVDNTSDAAKPVSTATQAAINAKAALADAVPSGGVYGQVLTVTHSGRQWVDPPGIVYPSLFMSPEGSLSTNVTVNPTVEGTVPIVAGQHGQAWDMTALGSQIRLIMPSDLVGVPFTALMRLIPKAGVAGSNEAGFPLLIYGNDTSVPYRTDVNTYPSGGWLRLVVPVVGGRETVLSPGVVETRDTPTTIGVRANGSMNQLIHAGQVIGRTVGTPDPTITYRRRLYVGGGGTYTARAWVESILLYPIDVPTSEIARIANMPTRWTMQNTAVNMALQSQPPATPTGASLLSYFPPNRKIAAGGATLRTAPGAATTAITNLAAGTDVHSTGQTITASTVSYTLVMTTVGQGWVPTTALI